MINLNKKLFPIQDNFIKKLKSQWLALPQEPQQDMSTFILEGSEWFRSTKRNNISGWESFPCVDAIMGCTHFIEAFILKHGWQGFQILEFEYSYYRMMGKHGVSIDQLEPGKPLIVSIPNWKTGDFPENWDDVVKICEKRNIDIHIDFAWLTTAKDMKINLDHPNIKSFAMSLSKYGQQWNRVGLRWSKQRSMDSVTIFNEFYGDVNTLAFACGLFMLRNIPRDYGWNTYETKYNKLVEENNLIPTKLLPVVKKYNDDQSYGISPYLY